MRNEGALVKVAGLVLVRQRPVQQAGYALLLLKMKPESLILLFSKRLFDHYRKEILQSRLLMVKGKVQIEGEVIHVIAKGCYNVSALLQKLTETEKRVRHCLLCREETKKDDENYTTKDKSVQRSMAVQGEIFHGGQKFQISRNKPGRFL